MQIHFIFGMAFCMGDLIISIGSLDSSEYIRKV